MRLNQSTAQKLRAGHTVWRCLIWFDHKDRPYVSIEEIHLVGVQWKSKSFSLSLRRTAIAYGGSPYYLSDIAHADAFTTRRGALRFRKDVQEGREQQRVVQRRSDLGW